MTPARSAVGGSVLAWGHERLDPPDAPPPSPSSTSWSSTAPTPWSSPGSTARCSAGRLEDDSDRDWATLVPPGGGLSPDNPDGRATLAFQRIDDFVRPTWPGGAHPQQFHLDLWAGDIAAAEPAVLAAGAIVHEHQPSENGGFKVYLDPAGHPFCLVGKP